MIRGALFMWLLLCPQALLADGPLTFQAVVTSALEHYPDVTKALTKIDAAQGDIESARGAFDRYIEGNVDTRLNGFYESNAAGAQLIQPLQSYNAQLYGGYRLSDGAFPTYEDGQVTANGGEASIGIVLSLLKNRAIDTDRAALFTQEIGADIADLALLRTKLDVQRKAMKAYANWLGAGWKRKVYQNLVDLAETRQSALSQRAKRGDIATITVTENEQFILQRQTVLREAERGFINAANMLALFWRDEAGKPKVPDAAALPDLSDTELSRPIIPEAELLVTQRPDFRLLNQLIAKERIQAQLGENALLPTVDVKLENNTDFGDGDVRGRESNETKLGFKLAIPLQTRYGKGKIRKAEASIRGLELEQTFLKEQLNVTLANLQENLDAIDMLTDLSEREIEVTRKMEAAERDRFRNGQSDFFLVNIREVNSGNAEIKRIEATRQYLATLADIYQATLTLAQ